MEQVARDVRAETPKVEGRSQTLTIPGNKRLCLSASARKNPTVALFRYREAEVAKHTGATRLTVLERECDK